MDWIWNLIVNNWDTILGFVLGISFIAALLKEVLHLIRQLVEFLNAILKGFEDGKLQPDEVAAIKKELADVKDAAKGLVSVFLALFKKK